MSFDVASVGAGGAWRSVAGMINVGVYPPGKKAPIRHQEERRQRQQTKTITPCVAPESTPEHPQDHLAAGDIQMPPGGFAPRG